MSWARPVGVLVWGGGMMQAVAALVCQKGDDDPVRGSYLALGRFGGRAATEGESIEYRFLTPHDGTETGPVAIAGPTCDGADILYERSNYRMPLALRCGDIVQIESTGAYTTTYASQRFNGFLPLAEHYI